MSNKPYGTRNQQDMAISFLNTGKTKEDFLKRHPNGINAWNWAKEKHEYLQTIPKIKEPKPFTIADYDSLYGDWFSKYKPNVDDLHKSYAMEILWRNQQVRGPEGNFQIKDKELKLLEEGKIDRKDIWMYYNYDVPYETGKLPFKEYQEGGKVNMREGLIEGAEIAGVMGGLGNLGRDDNLLTYLMDEEKAHDEIDKLIQKNEVNTQQSGPLDALGAMIAEMLIGQNVGTGEIPEQDNPYNPLMNLQSQGGPPFAQVSAIKEIMKLLK